MKIKTFAVLGFITTSLIGMSALAQVGKSTNPLYNGPRGEVTSPLFQNRPLWIQGFVGPKFVFGFNEQGSKKAGDYQLPHHFSVEIDGKLMGGLAHGTESFIPEVTGSQDVVEYKDGEDGTMHTRPGKMKVSREFSGKDLTFRDWFQGASAGKVDRRSISVIFHNDAGEEAGRMNFYNCWPTGYKGPALNSRNSAHATEKLEISYETMELKVK